MADIVDKATRSRMMAGIRGRDTRPEVQLRKALHAQGFRFRLQDRKLPGRPDIVLPRYHAVIFVNGCFWHRHAGCRLTTTPATRPEFWQAKFEGNRERDRKNMADLRAAGWRIAVVWECALRPSTADVVAQTVARWLRTSEPELELGSGQSKHPC